MRKEGLYIPGPYGTYVRKYEERRAWKEKWRHAVGIGAAVLLLAAALGSVATGRLGESLYTIRTALAEGVSDLSEAWSVSDPIRKISDTCSGVFGETAAVGAVSPAVLSAFAEYAPDQGLTERENWADTPYVFVEKAPADTLIVLDPGHGGEDEGCSRNGIEEKTINLEIVRAVQTKLLEQGYQVLLTRDADQTLTLEERVRMANEARADIYVSIHQNASEAAGAAGMEVWYNDQRAGAESERLSRLIHKYAVEGTGAVDREIQKTDELYIIRECAMPSCLVETGFLSNAAERARLTDPAYQERIAAGIVSGIEMFLHPKTMYLTFDDGPSAENTNVVLDILKERNIQATFFVIGESVRKHPETARRIVEEGHTIGIHCNSHEYTQIYKSVDSYMADFEEARNIVKEITGVDAKLFRFPGGSINAYNKAVYKGIIEAMTAKGYIYYDWNASLEDAVRKADPNTLIQNAVSSTLGRKKVVMLAHDVVYQTTLCLDELLDQFPEYQMLPLTEDVEPVQF